MDKNILVGHQAHDWSKNAYSNVNFVLKRRYKDGLVDFARVIILSSNIFILPELSLSCVTSLNINAHFKPLRLER